MQPIFYIAGFVAIALWLDLNKPKPDAPSEKQLGIHLSKVIENAIRNSKK